MRFGHGMREHWALDPDVLYLNHGTVGATPRRVLAAQQAIRDAMELQPSAFLLRECADLGSGWPRAERPRMRVAAGEIARRLGARGEDLVFVDNATEGVNTVLRSLPFDAGDEILLSDHGYGAVALAAGVVARERGAAVRTVKLPDPVADAPSVVEAFAAGLTPRTRLVVVDHVTSDSALILPVAAIAARCRAAGVPVLVDGAHAPGAIPLDIPSLGVTWYTGNLHKWGWAPRSSAILWVSPDRQAAIHPLVASWGSGKGFLAEFDWVGTRDPSPWLAAPAGFELMEEWGIEAIRAYNHGLAWSGARRLAELWDVPLATPEAMIGTMATVPLPARHGTTTEEATRLRDALLFEDRIEIQLASVRGRLVARLSAQIYVETADIERLARAVDARAPVAR